MSRVSGGREGLTQTQGSGEQRLSGEKQRVPVRTSEKSASPAFIAKGDLGALGWKWRRNGNGDGDGPGWRGRGDERM